MSILSTSPTSIRVFDINIANALGSSDAATILQQLHYWMQKEGVGVIVDGVKYVYNTFRQWIKEQFLYLTESKFIRAMNILRSLEIVKVDRCKAKNWNQTNHYSLNYQKLQEWAKAENIEISELADKPSQVENNQLLEMSDANISYIESKNTSKKEQQSSNAASSFEKITESDSVEPKPHSVRLSSASAQKKENIFHAEQNSGKETSPAKVDYIVNSKWKEQIKDLDSAGISVNKTLIGLLKSYEFERIESAIALFKTRKREQHIPNPAGYFVKALKEDWSNENTSVGNSANIDRASVFRYWYDLARELGYCSGQEIRDNEQWVCLSGSWEKWNDAVERGYSVNYLKKILKRNQGR